MQTAFPSLTAKESQLFSAIIDGMDERGCGWLHELAEPSRSVSAVLGSLVKKGLVDSSRDDNGAPSACYWVSLTDAGEALAAPAAPAAPSPILPGEAAAPAPLAPLSPAPSLPVWQAQSQQQPQQGAAVAVRRVKPTASQSAFCKRWNLSADKFLGINPKTVKSLKNGDPDVRILNLAPAELSGFNVCPGSGNCRRICLHFSGNPVGMSAKTLCRIRKTQAYFDNPQSFMELLTVAILGESFKLFGAPLAIRLNGTSDVKWEDVDFEVTVEFAAFCNRKFGVILLVGKQNIFELFQSLGLDVVFYDYTKIRRDWAKCAKLGYHLTFSFDGWDNTPNLKLCREAIANGVNIAAAFNLKKSLSLPTALEGGSLVDFSIPIVDGDLTDYRPADPAGVIVGLHYKHPLGLKMGPVEKDLFKRAFCIS